MRDEDWNRVIYFKKNERWGDPALISLDLVMCLDLFREYVKSPVIINSGTQGKHADNSNHYKGFAVDVKIPGQNLLDMWIAASRFGFTGIGIYPDWGLHLELVPDTAVRRLWIGVGDPPTYIPFNSHNIKTYL